jgi:hypothetical protein
MPGQVDEVVREDGRTLAAARADGDEAQELLRRARQSLAVAEAKRDEARRRAARTDRPVDHMHAAAMETLVNQRRRRLATIGA